MLVEEILKLQVFTSILIKRCVFWFYHEKIVIYWDLPVKNGDLVRLVGVLHSVL